MESSILITIKKLLGIDDSITSFDDDILVHINTAIMALRQIGIGPKEGFVVSGDHNTWNELVTSDKFEAVKTYIYLRVRILFDPPTSGTLMEAFKNSLAEYEWRLSVSADPEDSIV